MKTLQFFILLAITLINAEKKNFAGSKVYKIIPKTNEQVSVLESFRDIGLGDFWNEYFRVNDDVRVMVPPEWQMIFIGRLTQADIEVKTIIEDVQRVIDEQNKPSNFPRTSSFLGMDWENYHDLDTIETWMERVVEEFPDIVSPVTMAVKSFEGREIKGIKINYNPDVKKPLGMIEGTLHAREWISPATVTWMIKEFLTSTDADVRTMAENLEWHFFPVVNPDGYVYTFTTHRMWRKNRSTKSFTSCNNPFDPNDDMSNGVDLNRNFDIFWGEIGHSENPCSNLYYGLSAGSEPETQAISQYILSLKEKGQLLYYLSFHSYTQLFIYPYSHVENYQDFPAHNHDDLVKIANITAVASAKRFGTTYRAGTSFEVLYPLSGSSFDWAAYHGNALVSFLIELRDMGEYGFLLPKAEIIPNSLEIMDGLIEMDKTTRSLGYYEYDSGSASIAFSATLLLLGVTFVNMLR